MWTLDEVSVDAKSVLSALQLYLLSTRPTPSHSTTFSASKIVSTASWHQQNVQVASGTDNTENSEQEATGQGS
jgi:hypothetical protein